jgi:glycine/serine hydroxymethyltransferase
MSALTFDTLQFVQRLKKAGMQSNEAEAIAEVIAEAVRGVQTNTDIATKRDIAILETRIAETKAELIKWVVSVGVLQTALIGALLLRPIPG